jgi:hypothetical protein
MDDFSKITVEKRESATRGRDANGHIMAVQDEHMLSQT